MTDPLTLLHRLERQKRRIAAHQARDAARDATRTERDAIRRMEEDVEHQAGLVRQAAREDALAPPPHLDAPPESLHPRPDPTERIAALLAEQPVAQLTRAPAPDATAADATCPDNDSPPPPPGTALTTPSSQQLATQPAAALPAAPTTPPGGWRFDPDPHSHLPPVPAHPDHGLPACPRHADGSLNTYYLCSHAEIERFDFGAPPALNPRPGGWSVDRQERFIATLAASASVTQACAALSVTRNSAYRLRWAADAGAFRMAWDAALARATRVLADTAFDRAVSGVEEDVWFQGRIVGTRRRYNDRLLMFLLRDREGTEVEWSRPERGAEAYAAALDTLAAQEGARAMTLPGMAEPYPKWLPKPTPVTDTERSVPDEASDTSSP